MERWMDWYGQGKRDLGKAGLDFEHEYYERACFSAQQASEKAIKAAALKSGLTVWGRSLTQIPGILSSEVPVPPEILESAKLLDIYYIPARHPDGFPSGKPSDYFTAKQWGRWMRQIISSGSAKGFFLDRGEVLKRLRDVSASAVESMPEIREIRLFGSLAAGKGTGLSDADVFMVVETGEKNPIERVKPYYPFFSDRLGFALDIITAEPHESGRFSGLLRGSILLARGRAGSAGRKN